MSKTTKSVDARFSQIERTLNTLAKLAVAQAGGKTVIAEVTGRVDKPGAVTLVPTISVEGITSPANVSALKALGISQEPTNSTPKLAYIGHKGVSCYLPKSKADALAFLAAAYEAVNVGNVVFPS